MGEMNWVSRKIHLYNVTMGLYMLDCCFPLTGVDIMVLILLWFICFNGSRFASDVFERFTVIVKSMSTWFDNAIQGTKVDPPFKLLNN
uniref:Transmembrane protein n=1 Tax=Oryza barthii TaxID=65489 RepID=A0A0D3GQF9_9ORYZ